MTCHSGNDSFMNSKGNLVVHSVDSVDFPSKSLALTVKVIFSFLFKELLIVVGFITLQCQEL